MIPLVSLRAINKDKFTLMGDRGGERETKQIYGQHAWGPSVFCIYECPGDTKHTNHPGEA